MIISWEITQKCKNYEEIEICIYFFNLHTLHCPGIYKVHQVFVNRSTTGYKQENTSNIKHYFHFIALYVWSHAHFITTLLKITVIGVAITTFAGCENWQIVIENICHRKKGLHESNIIKCLIIKVCV